MTIFIIFAILAIVWTILWYHFWHKPIQQKIQQERKEWEELEVGFEELLSIMEKAKYIYQIKEGS